MKYRRVISSMLVALILLSTANTFVFASKADVEYYDCQPIIEEFFEKLNRAAPTEHYSEKFDKFYEYTSPEDSKTTPFYYVDQPDFGVVERNSAGGTIYLKKGGSNNSNITYTRIVYIPVEDVAGIMAAKLKPSLGAFIEDELISAGVGAITGVVAGRIAAYLSVPVSNIEWMVGLTAAGVTYILRSIDDWDLATAYEDSRTGAVSLEYYYANYPYYQNFKNYHPWHDARSISCPAGYYFDISIGQLDL